MEFNVGGKPAEAVYLGDLKLWPAGGGGIDPATAKIGWGASLVNVNYAGATIVSEVGTIPNLRAAPTADGGLRIQADAWHRENEAPPVAYVRIPIADAGLAALPADDRLVKPTARQDAGGSIGSTMAPALVLVNDARPTTGQGQVSLLLPGPVGGAILNTPSQSVPLAPIAATLRGANPALSLKFTYMFFGPTDLPALDITIRDVSFVAQVVAAP